MQGLEATRPHSALRIHQKHPSFKRNAILGNISSNHLLLTMRSRWYTVTHDLTPINEHLHRINLTEDGFCRLCHATDTTIHRLTSCGEARLVWYWTRQRLAMFLRVDKRNIPEEWILFPDFKLWPPQKHHATLWIRDRMVWYIFFTHCPQTQQDYSDFLRRSRWKTYEWSKGRRVYGGYLEVVIARTSGGVSLD
jgi:hypothetical protein